MRVTNGWAGVACAVAVGAVAPTPVVGTMQDATVVAHTVSVAADGSTLRLELSDGKAIVIEFTDGEVLIDGAAVGRYDAAGAGDVAESWSELLQQGGNLNSAELLDAVRAWESDESDFGDRFDAAVKRRMEALEVAASGLERQSARLAEVTAAQESAERALVHVQELGEDVVIDLKGLEGAAGLTGQIDRLRSRFDQIENLGIQVDDGQVQIGDLTVPRGRVIDHDLIVLSGDVSVFGTVRGNVVAVEGDVIMRPSGRIEGDVVTVNGNVIKAGGEITGQIRSERGLSRHVTARAARPRSINVNFTPDPPVQIASLLGMFIALACVGFGFTYFMPRQLEVVSNTVTDSFGKSFLAGLFAQPLLLPLFAMLIVGLAITVVGILLIPIAVIASFVAVVGAGTGGYLAVAKSVGATFLTRRQAQGHAVAVTPYRSLIFGLIGLMAIWGPAVILGWVPVVGDTLALLAAIFTWVMATAGFGAAILSRAGLRETFGRHSHRAALTDEYYWPAGTGEHRPVRRPIRRDR